MWPPNLGFWAPPLTYPQIIPNVSKKIAICKIKWKPLKRDKISEKIKFLFLNQIFYMMELKSDPPNLGFWATALTYLQIRPRVSQKK